MNRNGVFVYLGGEGVKYFEYFKPATLKEASELLIENGENAHILNGGTDLVVRMRDELTTPDVVVDIKGIKELETMRFDEEGLFIGATVNLASMIEYEPVVKHYSFLREAAESIGSGQVRNLATMVGNICNASPLADTSTPLLVLDAKLIIYGAKGEKEISIHEFFKGVRETSLQLGDIVTGIKIPLHKNIYGVFMKRSRRKEVDLSTVCTTVLKIEDEIRIAMGAVAPTPIRAPMAEGFAKGKELNPEIIEEIANIAAREAKPIDDVRSSKEYRTEMIKIMVNRSIEKLRDLGSEDCEI
nr:xanthine dehydrogenase family protein subunit M [Clostridium sp. Cult2]